MTRPMFPLQWPEGWARCATPKRSRFSATLFAALTQLRAELDRLGASHVTITSNLPVNSRGNPYGHAEDPGIAVWFVLNGQERVFACDRWDDAGHNMHALALTIDAMRGLERWGAGDVVTRAFAGFAALPAPEPVETLPRWVSALEMPASTYADLIGDDNGLAALLSLARVHHRQLIRERHPDHGGTHDAAVRLNQALADAESDINTRIARLLHNTK